MDISQDVVIAFFTGVGAVISMLVSLRTSRKRYRKECQEQIEEVKHAMYDGFRMGRVSKK